MGFGAVMLRLAAAAVIIVSLASIACSAPRRATSRASQTPSLGAAPSEAEITAVVKRLIKREHLGPIVGIHISNIEQDASGRWQARAYLTPPLYSSIGTLSTKVVKNPDGWQLVVLGSIVPGYEDAVVPQSSPVTTPSW
jgi:hypothetical protein